MNGKISSAKLRTLTKPGRYGDGAGLWLQVRDARHRSWLFRFTREGRGHWMGLGPVEDVTLAEARDRARDCRRLLLAGKDPIAERRSAISAEMVGLPFRDVAGKYIAAHEPAWRNAVHRERWVSTLDSYAHPVIGDMPVLRIDTGDVMRVLDPIWRDKPETAARLRGRVEAVLDYAAARGWRAGENPARWRGQLAKLLPARAKVANVNTTRRCHGRTRRPSWRSCPVKGARLRLLWSSRSSPQLAPAKPSAPDGRKSTRTRRCGPCRRSG